MKHIIKIITLFLLLHVSSQSQTVAQHKIVITGTILEANNVVYLSNKSQLIPLELKNNKFEITIQQQEGSFPENIAFITLSGSEIVKTLPDIWIDTDSVNLVIDVTKGKEYYKTNHKYKYQDISERIKLETNKKKQIELIKEHINTYPALFFLYEHHEKWNVEAIESVLNLAPKYFHSSILYERIKAYVEACQLTKPKKGKIFKPFSAVSKSGKNINIENTHGKYRLFAFVGSGCYYSLASLTELSKFHQQYKDKVDIITIWLDEDRDTWLNHEKDLKKQIVWTDVWDQTKFASEYFRISTYPSFYLVDKNGKIIKIIKGLNLKKLNKAFNSLK